MSGTLCCACSRLAFSFAVRCSFHFLLFPSSPSLTLSRLFSYDLAALHRFRRCSPRKVKGLSTSTPSDVARLPLSSLPLLPQSCASAAPVPPYAAPPSPRKENAPVPTFPLPPLGVRPFSATSKDIMTSCSSSSDRLCDFILTARLVVERVTPYLIKCRRPRVAQLLPTFVSALTQLPSFLFDFPTSAR